MQELFQNQVQSQDNEIIIKFFKLVKCSIACEILKDFFPRFEFHQIMLFDASQLYM